MLALESGIRKDVQFTSRRTLETNESLFQEDGCFVPYNLPSASPKGKRVGNWDCSILSSWIISLCKSISRSVVRVFLLFCVPGSILGLDYVSWVCCWVFSLCKCIFSHNTPVFLLVRNQPFYIVSREGRGAVVRALASHRCGSGSILRLGVICGLSLLVLFSALKGFFSGYSCFPLSTKNQYLIWFDLT